MAISGLGTGIGVTLSDGTHTYSDVIAIGVIGQSCDKIDQSHSNSPDEFAESLPGILDPGSIVVTIRYGAVDGATVPAEPGYLRTLFDARTTSLWTITIPGGATWSCYGFIQNLGIEVHHRGSTTRQLVIKCSGYPAYIEATV